MMIDCFAACTTTAFRMMRSHFETLRVFASLPIIRQKEAQRVRVLTEARMVACDGIELMSDAINEVRPKQRKAKVCSDEYPGKRLEALEA